MAKKKKTTKSAPKGAARKAAGKKTSPSAAKGGARKGGKSPGRTPNTWELASYKALVAFQEERELPKAALARTLDVSNTTYNSWGPKKAPNLRTQEKIAKLLEGKLTIRRRKGGDGADPNAAPNSRKPAWESITLDDLQDYIAQPGKTKAGLARELSMSPGAIHNWFSGNSIPTRAKQRKIRELIDGASPDPTPSQASSAASSGGAAEAVVSAAPGAAAPSVAATPTDRAVELLQAYFQGGNAVPPSQLPDLIQQVRDALR